MTPEAIYFDPFAGGGGDFIPLLHPSLVPPVSWMGGKRKQAKHHHALLGLRPGKPPPMVLGDASWWGWVWPTLLDPVAGPEVSTMLRFWRPRDPRQLWFWLRDVGPMAHRVEAAAQLLWLQARAASGVPVWWEGQDYLAVAPGDGRERQRAYQRSGELVSMDGHGRGPYPAWQATGIPAEAGLRQSTRTGGSCNANGKGYHGRPAETELAQWTSTRIDRAGQRQATEPELLASDGRGVPRNSGQRTERLVVTTRGGQVPGALFGTGHKGMDERGGGGIVDTNTVALRLDAIRARLVQGNGKPAGFGYDHVIREARGWRAFETEDVAERVDRIRYAVSDDLVVYHCDAAQLTEEWAPRAGARARVLLDPPYDGATGYPAACARREYLEIAATWARHGARVVLCEAEGLASELGPGWAQSCIRPKNKKGKGAEWVTTYNCDTADLLPPLLRHIKEASCDL